MLVDETAHAEWLEARTRTIGASEVAAVLGLDPWQTPLQLYLRKRGEIPATEPTMQMEAGHRMEPVIAEWYSDDTGREVQDLGRYTIQRNAELPFMHATLDRIIMPCDGHEMPGTLQIKNVTAYKSGEWAEGVPLHTQIQVQAEMAVAKMDWGSVAALIGGNQFVWQDQERNDDFIVMACRKCGEFMANVERGIPPEASASDNDALGILWPHHVPEKVVELPMDAADWYAVIERTEAAIVELQIERDAAKAKVKQAIGDAERGVLPDGSGWTWKTQHVKESIRPAYDSRVLRRVKAKGVN